MGQQEERSTEAIPPKHLEISQLGGQMPALSLFEEVLLLGSSEPITWSRELGGQTQFLNSGDVVNLLQQAYPVGSKGSVTREQNVARAKIHELMIPRYIRESNKPTREVEQLRQEISETHPYRGMIAIVSAENTLLAYLSGMSIALDISSKIDSRTQSVVPQWSVRLVDTETGKRLRDSETKGYELIDMIRIRPEYAPWFEILPVEDDFSDPFVRKIVFKPLAK